MTMTRQLSFGLAVIGATLIGCAASQAGVAVYDNTTYTDPSASRFKIGNTIELGDEVYLDLNGASAVSLESFSFEYYGLNFTGTEQVRVRFYGMNPLSAGGTPSSLLWDSGNISLAPTEAGVLRFSDFTGGVQPLAGGVLPDDVLWTVEFSGLHPTTGGEAGLDIYTPPTVGNNLVTYWQKMGGSWKMCQAVDDGQQLIVVDFGAQFTGVPVPEPTVTALGLLGLAGFAGAALKRRISRR
jgi:hypothetical protein